ncbi:MAG: outer membrane protein [Methylovirgula sp.]
MQPVDKPPRRKTMKLPLCSFLSAALVVPALAGGAVAGGNSAPAPFISFIPPSTFNWTGFYGGESGTYSWSDGGGSRNPDGLWTIASDAAGSAFSAANGSSPQDPHNILGGGQLGFNYQIQNLVLGAEGDLSYTGLDTTAGVFGPPRTTESLAFTPDINSHWLSTIRGRFGTAIDRLLVFATGGLAVAGRNFNNGYTVLSPDGQDFSIGNASRVAAGVAFGGGLEYALNNHWTVKGEYLYADLGAGGSFMPSDAPLPINTGNRSTDMSEKVIRAAINYKFDWPNGPSSTPDK